MSELPSQLSSQPQEGFLEVIVALGRDVVVLKVLLAVEGDSLSLNLTLLEEKNMRFRIIRHYLNIDFVTAKYNGDVVTDTDEIAMPVGNILISDAGSDVEHDDGALARDTNLLVTVESP